MIGKLIRSVKKRGLTGTARAIGAVVSSWNPHIRQHLPVPVEMLKHPAHAAGWIHDRVSRAGPSAQGLPWIAWPSIDFLHDYVRPTHRVFEWGGGGSTIFFLKKGCRLTTVESSEEWVGQLEQQIIQLGGDARSRWDLRFVTVVDNQDPAIIEYIRQVDVGAPWDVVMVDGWSRMKCFHAAIDRVKPGGVLMLDNADQKQYAAVPGTMQGHGWIRHRFRGLGVARSWVTQTDAYERPK